MVRLGAAAGSVKSAALCNVYFTAYDGSDIGAFAKLIEFHGTVKNAVIGYGEGSLSQLLCTLNEPAQSARAVKQAVFGMHMKMYELRHDPTLLLMFIIQHYCPVIKQKNKNPAEKQGLMFDYRANYSAV